jgi:hypothetical protein
MVFSENYELVWGNRKGFAKVAIEAKVVRNKNPEKKIKRLMYYFSFYSQSFWYSQETALKLLKPYGFLKVIY